MYRARYASFLSYASVLSPPSLARCLLLLSSSCQTILSHCTHIDAETLQVHYIDHLVTYVGRAMKVKLQLFLHLSLCYFIHSFLFFSFLSSLFFSSLLFSSLLFSFPPLLFLFFFLLFSFTFSAPSPYPCLPILSPPLPSPLLLPSTPLLSPLLSSPPLSSPLLPSLLTFIAASKGVKDSR